MARWRVVLQLAGEGGDGAVLAAALAQQARTTAEVRQLETLSEEKRILTGRTYMDSKRQFDEWKVAKKADPETTVKPPGFQD